MSHCKPDRLSLPGAGELNTGALALSVPTSSLSWTAKPAVAEAPWTLVSLSRLSRKAVLAELAMTTPISS